MGWERPSGRGRYYIRRTGKPANRRTQYFGAGQAGRLAAEVDEIERQDKARRRQTQRTFAHMQSHLDAFKVVVDATFAAWLASAGYHQHRGEIRRKRNAAQSPQQPPQTRRPRNDQKTLHQAAALTALMNKVYPMPNTSPTTETCAPEKPIHEYTLAEENRAPEENILAEPNTNEKPAATESANTSEAAATTDATDTESSEAREEFNELMAAIPKARDGDKVAAELVGRRFAEYPHLAEYFGGNLAVLFHEEHRRVMCGKDKTLWHAVDAHTHQLRKQLAGDEGCPIRSLLADYIVACWLQLYTSEINALQGRAEFTERYERTLTKLHRRFLNSIETPAKFQKLNPQLEVNVNIGDKAVANAKAGN